MTTNEMPNLGRQDANDANGGAPLTDSEWRDLYYALTRDPVQVVPESAVFEPEGYVAG